MNRPSWLQRVYWSHFGKPVEERQLFKILLSRPVQSVLQVGIGDGSRLRRIVKLAKLSADIETIRFIGTDEFESAGDRSHRLSLKQAHQLASGLGLKRASLIPGNSLSALPRVAHKFGASDLLVIDSGLDLDGLGGPVGTWLNRLAHENSIVLASNNSGDELVPIDISDLDLAAPMAA